MTKPVFVHPPSVISNHQITLKPWVNDYAQLLFTAVQESSQDAYPFLEWCHPHYEITESQRWIALTQQKWQRREWFDFAIFDNTSGAFLGGCGLNDIHFPQAVANLGYWTRSTATKTGIATQATQLLAQFGFQHLKLQRIEITIAESNIASIRVAEKSGAVLEAMLRSKLKLHGKYVDALLYTLLPSDFG